jgi:hypothetical protein
MPRYHELKKVAQRFTLINELMLQKRCSGPFKCCKKWTMLLDRGIFKSRFEIRLLLLLGRSARTRRLLRLARPCMDLTRTRYFLYLLLGSCSLPVRHRPGSSASSCCKPEPEGTRSCQKKGQGHHDPHGSVTAAGPGLSSSPQLDNHHDDDEPPATGDPSRSSPKWVWAGTRLRRGRGLGFKPL